MQWFVWLAGNAGGGGVAVHGVRGASTYRTGAGASKIVINAPSSRPSLPTSQEAPSASAHDRWPSKLTSCTARLAATVQVGVPSGSPSWC